MVELQVLKRKPSNFQGRKTLDKMNWDPYPKEGDKLWTSIYAHTVWRSARQCLHYDTHRETEVSFEITAPLKPRGNVTHDDFFTFLFTHRQFHAGIAKASKTHQWGGNVWRDRLPPIPRWVAPWVTSLHSSIFLNTSSRCLTRMHQFRHK